MKLCSACLLGIKCRYDGNDSTNPEIIALSEKEKLIPICPEELGGLRTPREPSEIRDGKVFSKSGKDVTGNFIKGAEAALSIAVKLGINQAILKQNSPSCGCGFIYDGTFSGKLVRGDGFTAALLKKNNITVIPDIKLKF